MDATAIPVRELTACAVRAARAAGAIALDGFRSPDLAVETKADMYDLVTRYDGECEARIREILAAEFPGSRIIGEEGGETDGTDREAGGAGAIEWHVDPIDGTSNFARGVAMWAVSIAAVVDGEVVSGVVYDPVAGDLFWADDRGAFLGDTPIRSRGSADPARAMVAMNFPLARDLVHFPELALEQFAEVTRAFGQVRSLGSTCIALCWIAAGWLDATVSFETSSWDVAAAAFIVRRAGGTYVAYRDGEAQPPAGDFAHPHYFAAVAGAEFPMLREIMRTQSLRPAR
ncbi:MAG: inositol monophosphatase family protein [Leucobacter sp.]